jgi:hypothetical protein
MAPRFKMPQGICKPASVQLFDETTTSGGAVPEIQRIPLGSVPVPMQVK